MYKAIKHFRYILKGRAFSIRADHKPLIYAFGHKSSKASQRQFGRQLDFNGQFTTDIKYISGSSNIVADALSRLEEFAVSAAFSFAELSAAQQQDKKLQTLLRQPQRTSLQLQQLNFRKVKFQYGAARQPRQLDRPYMPLQVRKTILEGVHSLSHPGGRSTIKQVAEKYV